MALTAEQVDKLTETLGVATKRLEETRQSMEVRQKEIGEALDRMKVLEQKNTDGGSERDALKQRLEKLAGEVQSIAEQHTNLLTQVRNATLQLGQSGQAEDKAYVYPGGNNTVFASRQQAVQLGYFFMATMRADNHSRRYAQTWLREHAADLCYLPNVPKMLLQTLGESTDRVIKACITQGLQYGAQALAGNVTPGSILVAPQFAEMLIRNVEQYGAFRQNVLIWPMGADMTFIPRRTGGMTLHWEGEAAAPGTTEPSFDLLQAIAKKVMGLYYCSNELAEDENSAIALADIIVAEFALAFALEEDRLGFTGTGTGGDSPGFAGVTGVLGLARQAFTVTPDPNKVWVVTGAATLDRTDEITLKSQRNMTALLPRWARRNAKWYGHRTVNGDLLGIETTGFPVALWQNQGMIGEESFLRYPMVDTDVMPAGPAPGASTATHALGDLRKAFMLGERRQQTVETSDQFLFSTDQLATRASERIAIRHMDGTALVVYVTGTT